MKRAIALLLLCFWATPATARLSLRGEFQDLGAYYPVQDIGENRGRLHLKLSYLPRPFLLVRAAAYGEFLARNAGTDGIDTNFRSHETYVEIRGDRFDLQAGYINVVWGVLDEVQPTDVVNPLDVSRFFLENRAEARLPIAAATLRVYLPQRTRIEIVSVPFFEKGVFDQLDEGSSPFNFYRWLLPSSLPRQHDIPSKTLRHMEYGMRLSSTIGRVDVDLCFYRGREDFPFYTVVSTDTADPDSVIVGSYPRFTMVGGDMETVVGTWGFRAEMALFLEDSFQDLRGKEVIHGKSFQLGAGIDRQLDDLLIVGELVVQGRWAPRDFAERREEIGFIGGVERSFHFGREKLESFFIYNPLDNTLFVRTAVGIRPLPGFWLELTGGLFAGSGSDLVGRFDRGDFLMLSGRYLF